MSLKYYKTEDKKFRRADSKDIPQQEALKLCARLSRHYGVPTVPIYFKKAGWSFMVYHAPSPWIELAEGASYLTFLHEFAHYLDYVDRKKEEKALWAKMAKQIGRPLNSLQKKYYSKAIWSRHWHSQKHALLVENCVNVVKSWGYKI